MSGENSKEASKETGLAETLSIILMILTLASFLVPSFYGLAKLFVVGSMLLGINPIIAFYEFAKFCFAGSTLLGISPITVGLITVASVFAVVGIIVTAGVFLVLSSRGDKQEQQEQNNVNSHDTTAASTPTPTPVTTYQSKMGHSETKKGARDFNPKPPVPGAENGGPAFFQDPQQPAFFPAGVSASSTNPSAERVPEYTGYGYQ